MFKVTIIRLKDIIKFICSIIIIFVICRIMFRAIKIPKQDINIIKTGINAESSIIKNVSSTDLPIEDGEEEGFNLAITDIFKTGTNIFNSKEIKKEVKNEEQVEEKKEEVAVENEKKVAAILPTEVVTPNPIQESFNQEYNGVKIKNETSYELTDEILNPSNLDINTDNVIIFHTHTCESYTQSEEFQYNETGNYRTTDLKYSVARVGDELTNSLNGLGFKVNHTLNYHDYPAYTGSYNRSLATVEGILNDFKSDIIIDLHRDAIGSKSDYAPTVKIGEDYCAQLMFVMGTDGGGLSHPNWSDNLKFAMKIQETANSMYPGLFKPLILRNSRYNQHLGKAACIIEVGATGNTLNQAINSMKYLATIMLTALK